MWYLDNTTWLGASSAPPFTPAKLEHSEQLELGYLPLRDDFDRVNLHNVYMYYDKYPKMLK